MLFSPQQLNDIQPSKQHILLISDVETAYLSVSPQQSILSNCFQVIFIH